MPTIGYAGNIMDARQERTVGWFFWAAVACGILPMMMGVGVVAGYWWSYWGRWLSLEPIVLLTGFMTVMLGVAFLIVWGVIERKRARAMNLRFKRKAFLLTLLLLLSNFGVAAGCIAAGWHLAMRTMVEVVNETGTKIDVCTIQLPGGQKWVERDLPPGGRVRRSTAARIEGRIGMTLEQGGGWASVELEGYAPGVPGAHIRVFVRPGLKAEVKRL